jgi:hypothetical protein
MSLDELEDGLTTGAGSPCAGYITHPFTNETVFTFASRRCVRLFPPSSQGLAACTKAIVVQITTAFPSVSHVQSARCSGVPRFHLLCSQYGSQARFRVSTCKAGTLTAQPPCL